MFNSSIRFPQLRRAAGLALVLSILISVCVVGYGIGFGASLANPAEHTPWEVAGFLIAGGALLLAWSIRLWCLIDLAGKTESTTYRTHDVLMDIKEAMDEQSRVLRDIAENTQLSDAARSIAHREREQNVLRQAINEDILREDWEAAYYLVEQLE